MKAPTALTSALAALALAAPASAQLAGNRPDAAELLDHAQPFVTEAVLAAVDAHWLQWQEDAANSSQFCLDGRVVEDSTLGSVASVEALTAAGNFEVCRGKWTLGGLAFLPAGEHTDEEITRYACRVLSMRPDWHLFGIVNGETMESDSHWCANLRADEEEARAGTGAG
ncbi:MAG: hypothetical protein PVG79_08875 [Gemmatimonadales bacterium]|jgi:hypothetical protein